MVAFDITVAFLILYFTGVELVLVRVEQGLLRGDVLKLSIGDGEYDSFKGIPYAAPPIGDLRFKEPQPPLPWKGERCAKSHRSVCPQIDLATNVYTPGSEDCLFLNVYTPKLKPESRLPVMFFIHSGGLISGSGNDDQYKPDLLIDNDVIVVTINYRLGALGFLSLDIEEAPGNAGLKDQVAAMQWVKKNIANFGGDPNNVTIFGQSVGGSSVSLHVLSPMSKGLFQRAIAMSGVFLNDFFISFEHKRRALLFTQQLGLYTQDPKEALKFLQQNVSVEALVKTRPFVLYYEKPRRDVFDVFPFTPVVEKPCCDCQNFLTEDPEQLLREGKSNIEDMILGHTEQEGACRVMSQKKYILKYFPIYKELLVPSKIAYVRDPGTVLKLADRIQTHYFGDKEISKNTMKELITFYSYYLYIYDIHRYLEMWTQSGKTAYFYGFTGYSKGNIYGKYGARHGFNEAARLDNLPYLFDGSKYPLKLNKNSSAYKLLLQTCSLFTNFAKYGNPTPNEDLNGVIWSDYSNNKSYLEIDSNFTIKSANIEPQIDFWRSIFKSAGLIFS